MTAKEEKIVAEATVTQQKYPSILLFGSPGAGKGTLGVFLGNAETLYHLSSGDIFRGLDANSEGGRLFHQYADKGSLVPDEVTVKIWRDHVIGLIAAGKYNPQEQFLLLDGIPRNENQVDLINEYVNVDAIIALTVEDEQEIVRRLLARSEIEGRADDADISILRKRFEVYKEETTAILSKYPHEIIHRFDASKTKLEVAAAVLGKLASIMSYPAGR